jgi:hypothetical protein
MLLCVSCGPTLLQVRGEISIKRLDALIQEDVQVRDRIHGLPAWHDTVTVRASSVC